MWKVCCVNTKVIATTSLPQSSGMDDDAAVVAKDREDDEHNNQLVWVSEHNDKLLRDVNWGEKDKWWYDASLGGAKNNASNPILGLCSGTFYINATATIFPTKYKTIYSNIE